MAEKMTSINPNMLIWCRETCGISIEEVFKKFGDKIYNWEKGNDFPTYSQLQQLCDLYRKPVIICFFPEPPIYNNLSTSFRTIPSEIEGVLLNSRIIKLIDEARAMQLNLYELNDNGNYRYQIFSSNTFSQNICQMADELRMCFRVNIDKQKQIKTSTEYFEYWREKFTDIGIYVFKEAFGEDGTSGFCLYDDIFPIIYINNSLSYTRQIFTLFHELFHIIKKTSGIDMLDDNYYHEHLNENTLTIERNCNAFAGEFLVPYSDFIKQINNKSVNEEYVSKLASMYCVSREVILRKFLDINWISQDEYNERSKNYYDDYLRIKEIISANKSSGNYYNTLGVYKGRQYTELVFKKYYSNNITLIQAAKYMNMKIPSIRSFAEKKGWGSL